MKLLVSFSLSVFMEDSENFRAAPVGSLVFREDTIFKKNCRGSWEAYEEEEAVFLGTMQGPAGMQVPIGGLQYRSELVADTMVWCPVLSAGTAGPSEDPGNLLQELVRSVVQQAAACSRGRSRKRRRSGSSESSSAEEETVRQLPKELRDIAMPQKLVRKLSSRKVQEFHLEDLLDQGDLVKKDIVSSDRVVKAVLVLARYRVAFHPHEANGVLKFVANVQALASSYDFRFVKRVVEKHLRAVSSGGEWEEDLPVGSGDHGSHFPLCSACQLHHLGSCVLLKVPVSVGAFSTRKPVGRVPMAEVRCFNCSELGHYSKWCPRSSASSGRGWETKQRVPPKVLSPHLYGVQMQKEEKKGSR